MGHASYKTRKLHNHEVDCSVTSYKFFKTITMSPHDVIGSQAKIGAQISADRVSQSISSEKLSLSSMKCLQDGQP